MQYHQRAAAILNASIPLASSEVLLLLAISDHIGEAGVAWPSQLTLQRKTRLTERTIRRVTARLVGRGILSLVDARRRSTTYAIRWELLSVCVDTQLGRSGHGAKRPSLTPRFDGRAAERLNAARPTTGDTPTKPTISSHFPRNPFSMTTTYFHQERISVADPSVGVVSQQH